MSIISFLKRDFSLFDKSNQKLKKEEIIRNPDLTISSIYDISLNSIDGVPVNLNDFKGKKMLIVNVSPDCSFSTQVNGLNILSENYQKELIVIGVPCDQFDKSEVKKTNLYYRKELNVNFLLTQKMDVKGDHKHSLYQFLTELKHNKVKDSVVNWNFQKYLIDENGELVKVWFSITKPNSVAILGAL